MAPLAIFAETATVPVVAAVAVDAARASRGRVARAAVACRADQAVMSTVEREARPLVMVERPRLPVDRSMAVAASGWRAQCTGVMIVLVTIGACGSLRSECSVRMAFHALDLGMLAQQGEAAERMIEADVRFPIRTVVAAAACGSKLAGMNIIRPMAGCALHRELELVGWGSVAGFAAHGCMRALQGKPSHLVMVETGELPPALLVATRAVVPISALVRIVGGMTSDAGRRGLLRLRRLLVASTTGRRPVRAAKREARHRIVVEADLLPTGRGVTGGAVGAVLALVHVIGGVAAAARPHRMLPDIARAMTARATGCRMGPQQGKARTGMVERGLLPGRGPMA
mgnify:CR=1 FL=1